MRPTWLIEADAFGEASEPLKAELRRQGLAYHVVRPPSLAVVNGRPLPEDACVVFQGTLPLMRQIQLHHAWTPGGWCDAANLACSTYYAYFGRFLLNQRYMILPGVEAIRLRDWVLRTVGREDEVFIRPDGCGKLFTGRVVSGGAFADALAPTRYDPTTLVVLAEPREVAREWRLVVAGDRVVAASQYAVAGAPDIAPGGPDVVHDFAAAVLAEVAWRPDQMFMMDVGESEGRLSLIELNSFSCSGLYACDLKAVVATAADLAMKAWEVKHGR